MSNPIPWEKKCEEIASELVEDVCRKFVNDEEIALHDCRNIAPGPVYGLSARIPLHDEWNTVNLEYSVIPRSEITLDREALYKAALEEMVQICRMECWQKHKNSPGFADILREYGEWAVGTELSAEFTAAAAAAPGKYPIRKNHAHTLPPLEERLNAIANGKTSLSERLKQLLEDSL